MHMIVLVEDKPVKVHGLHPQAWMFGLLFGILLALLYLGEAGTFGASASQTIGHGMGGIPHMINAYLAIAPVNFLYSALLRPILGLSFLQFLQGSRVVFLITAMVFHLAFWPLLFQFLFPLTPIKIVSVIILVALYFTYIFVFSISPTICVECLQSTAKDKEYDPGAFLKGK